MYLTLVELLRRACSAREDIVTRREIRVQGVVDPLVRCVPAKGFAYMGQSGMLARRGKVSKAGG
jgi:hypothetical protein